MGKTLPRGLQPPVLFRCGSVWNDMQIHIYIDFNQFSIYVVVTSIKIIRLRCVSRSWQWIIWCGVFWEHVIVHCSKRLGEHFVCRVTQQCKGAWGAPVWSVVKPGHLWIDFTATVLGANDNVSAGEWNASLPHKQEWVICEGRQTQFSSTDTIRC